MDMQYKVGSILENSIRQFTKIITAKNGIYGLSGWMSREHAEKATVVRQRMNKYGLQYACVRIVTGSVERAAPSRTSTPSAKVNKTSTKKTGSAPTTKKKGKTGKSKKK
jgi:hypothetical protein